MNGWVQDGTPEWERVWQALAKRPGVTSLDGWQYLGWNPAYHSHIFRLRAGMPGNIFKGRNWQEMVEVAS